MPPARWCAMYAPPSTDPPLVTAREIRELSLPRHGLQRVRSGVYTTRDAWSSARPWERYRMRVAAFGLTSPGAVFCLESAAVLLGLPVFGEPRDIHVFDPERATSTRYGDVCVHTSTDPRTVVDTPGGASTSTLDTVVDLARVLPPAQALAVADAAASPFQQRAAPVVEPAAFRDLTDSRADRRGRARCRWVWARVDGRAESPFESVSRAVIEWLGFEEADLQCELAYEGHRDRVDFLFASMGGIGEADGWSKYALADGTAAGERLRAEKRREDRLRRAGHAFARWEYDDAVAAWPLERILRAARIPQPRPHQRAFLSTLTRTPRALARDSHPTR